MSYTSTILATMRNIGYGVTPSQLQDILFTQGVSIKKGTIKRILYRLWRRDEISRPSRGLYFFKSKGDSINHSRGQKGTDIRGINHFKESKDNSVFTSKRGQKNDLNGINHSQKKASIFPRVCAIFFNCPKVEFTIKKIHNRLGKNENYRTVQSAINYFIRRGIVKRVRRGIYKLADRDLALAYLERDTPKGPSIPLAGTIPLPTLKYTAPKIKGVIVPRDIFERVINQPPKIDPLLMISSPREGDRARQWKIETEQVKIMIPEKTLKATIYIKGPEWKSDLVELFGGWIIIELQGKKWMTEAAINMKELLQFNTMKARVGDIKVSVDQSIFGDDYDLEFQGEVGDVNTAILHTLIGPAAYADRISELKKDIQYIGKEVIEMSSELAMLKMSNNTTVLEKKLQEMDEQLQEFSKKLKGLDRKIEVVAGGIVKVIEQTKIPTLAAENQDEKISEGVEGYA